MLVIAAAALFMAGTAVNSVPVGGDVAAVTNWVHLVDAKRYEDSWSEAGNLFKSQLPQASWASIIQPVRDPLGTVMSRSLISIARSTTLPGAPDGDYEVVQFQTKFDHKSDAIETVVLARESSIWKVDGYFIR